MKADSLPEENNQTPVNGESNSLQSSLPLEASASPITGVESADEVSSPETQNSVETVADATTEPESPSETDVSLINTQETVAVTPVTETESPGSVAFPINQQESVPIQDPVRPETLVEQETPSTRNSTPENTVVATTDLPEVALTTSNQPEAEPVATPLPLEIFTPKVSTGIEAKKSPSVKTKLRIFITGASGCIGHYLTETLMRETEHELFLLVRNPDKLKFDPNSRPNVTVVKGDMRYIERQKTLLKTMDCVVMVATAWGGQQAVHDVNVFKAMQLLNFLDPNVCQQVIYFSTASVLDRNNQLLKQAGQIGTDYIRSKYEFLKRVSKVPISDRMTVVFPTLVLGGDEKHPYSHVSEGLPGLTKWIKWIRWFKADASFHFIHSQDIAQVIRHLIDHPPAPDNRWIVLGNPAITVNQAVEDACAYLNKPIFFRLSLSPWLTDLLIALFKIQMAGWDRFCLEYRHFTYQNPVNPATFGLPVYCAKFTDVLKISGVVAE